MNSLHPKRTVLITGGTGSIGRALVVAFAKGGFDVTFSYFSSTEKARELEAQTGARAIRLDLSRPHDIELPSPFEVLVNNAGINISRVITEEVKDLDLERTLAVNCLGVFQLCRMVLPAMRAAAFGRIVNVGSIYGLRGSQGNAPYVMSKHALVGLTRTIAREYGQWGITCNVVCPGPVESQLMERIAEYAASHDGSTREAYLEDIRHRSPTGRMALPEEVAAVCLFLAMPEASHVNGADIPVDGAWIA